VLVAEVTSLGLASVHYTGGQIVNAAVPNRQTQSCYYLWLGSCVRATSCAC
jgi:hypothetical protein